MPFGDLFKLPEGFKRRRSAPNRMEGLSFPQKLNYMGQFEGPSLMALGAGIASGHPEQGWADMAKLQAGYQGAYADEAEQDRTRQQTMEYLIQNGIDPSQAEAASQNPEILKHIFDLEEEKQRVAAGGDQNAFAPVLMRRADGSYYYASPDPNTGQLKPYGSEPGSNPIDPFTGAELKAGGAVAGKFNMEQAVQAPGVIASSEDTLRLISELERDSAKAWGTGLTGIMNAVPGRPGFDFANRVKQVNAQAMTQAIQKLHGLGAMSDADRDAAMTAATRVVTATSEKEFDAALADYKYRVQYGMQVAREKAAAAGVGLQPAYNPPTSTDPAIAPAPGGGGVGGITIEEVPD